MGARLLEPVLVHFKREQTDSAQTQSTSVGMLEAFFALSWARFGQGWRPDVPLHLDRWVMPLVFLCFGLYSDMLEAIMLNI